MRIGEPGIEELRRGACAPGLRAAAARGALDMARLRGQLPRASA